MISVFSGCCNLGVKLVSQTFPPWLNVTDQKMHGTPSPDIIASRPHILYFTSTHRVAAYFMDGVTRRPESAGDVLVDVAEGLRIRTTVSDDPRRVQAEADFSWLIT